MYGFISRYLRIIPIMRSFRSFWGCRGINHSQDKLISRGEPATDHPGGDLWKGASPQWWVAKVLALVIGAVPICPAIGDAGASLQNHPALGTPNQEDPEKTSLVRTRSCNKWSNDK